MAKMLPTIRRPEVSLGLGLATATVAYGVYQFQLPKAADVRASKAGDEHLDTSRMQAAWLAAGIVAGISLLAKDMTIFIVGGGTVVALDWTTRYNNWVNPLSGRIDLNPFTVEGANAPATNTTPTEDVRMGELQAVM